MLHHVVTSRARASLTLLAGLLLFACTKTNDPVVIEMSGGNITLSSLQEAYDEINGAESFANATIPERRQFAETWANKEMLLREAKRTVKEPSDTTRIQLKRYRERFLESAFWRQMSDGVEVPKDTIDYHLGLYRKQILCSVIQTSTREEAMDVKRKLDAGESFETLARLYSTDRYSKEAGGRLEWTGLGGRALPLVTNYAFFNLEKGQISEEPMETPKGFHIVRLDDIRMIEPSPEEEELWRRGARQAFFRNRTRAIKDSLLQIHRVAINAAALEPLRRGYYVFWDSLNTLQANTGGVSYVTLEPPTKSYWSEEEWNMPLVSFDDKVWSIGEFTNSLRDCDLEFWPTKSNQIEAIHRNINRRMIRMFCVESAAKWGWEDSDWFKGRYEHQAEKLLLDDYYYGVLAREFTITDEDVKNYIKANPEDFVQNDMIDFGFIRFPAGAEADAAAVVQVLRQGGDWEDVGQNQTLANPDVVFVPSTGLGAGEQYPGVANHAKRLIDTGVMPLNAYSDPVLMADGVAIVRVTSRVPGNPMTPDVAALFVRSILRTRGVEQVLQEKVPELREKYAVRIVEEVLGMSPGSTVS